MPIEKITAKPHPDGNRIDLAWVHSGPAAFPRVRVVRREGSYPFTPEPGPLAEGRVVADTNPTAPDRALVEVGEDGIYRAADEDLQGETVYYYALFPYKGDPPVYDLEGRCRAAAMATAPYGFAQLMHDLLPAIYHRYDTALPLNPPQEMSQADRQRGQLRRFLDLPGGQLDQIYSYTRALLHSHELDRLDGRLLPLLAQWIAWPTDFRLGFDAQRNEIRNAPALYQRVGLIPTVAATVKRISGWESQSKEFVHNVFASNRPERLNLWLRSRDAGGGWSEPGEPLSLNFAYEGRPAAARDGDNNLRLFFHTPRKGGWAIWSKTLSAGDWAPSKPLVDRGGLDRHPAVARQGDTLWLFWDSCDQEGRDWRIEFRSLSGDEWSAIGPVKGQPSPFGTQEAERRSPTAAEDPDGGLWLFWLERVERSWRVRFNRHDGAAWQLDPAAGFPLEGADPRVESDLFLMAHPSDPIQRLWLFWARREAAADPGQTRWSLFYRVKGGFDPSLDSDWSAVQTLAKADADDQEREPALLVDSAGNLEVFLASNRDGSWSVWRNTLGIAGVAKVADLSAHAWNPAAAEAVTSPPFSERCPLAVAEGDGALLFYRSNRSLHYDSQVYGALRTIDSRYAGATTVHVRNSAKLALRGELEDFATYTYDTGREEDDWYARDTLGVYLAPDTFDPDKIARGVQRIQRVLREFIPATDRTVMVTRPELHMEAVYSYDFPSGEQSFISEGHADLFSAPLAEIGLPEDEDFFDELET